MTNVFLNVRRGWGKYRTVMDFFQSINVLLIDYVIYIMQRNIIETTFIHEFVERGK